MASEKILWSLLHIESKTQFDSLSYEQASLLAQSFDPSEYGKWAAWNESLPDWQILEELVLMLGVKPKLKVAAPPEKPKPPAFHGVTHSGHTNPAQEMPVAEAITQTRTNSALSPDGRMSKRFAKKYKVYVGTKGKMLESTTVDMSLTGLQIVDPIPAGNEGNLEVALVNSKGENLSLICSIIPDERRNRLKIVRAGKLDQLQQWLQNTAD